MDESTAPNGYRVLMVEDDAVLRQTCALTLRSRKLTVFEAENGLDGLRVFQENPVDAILLDALMPVLDGFETCQRLRQLPGGERIPILMITGLEDSESINRAYDVGATDFIPKPVHFGILSQRLLRLIEGSQRETKLQNKRLQFELLYRALPEAAVFSRFDRTVITVNPAFKRQFGYRERDVVNRNEGMLYQDHAAFVGHAHEVDALHGKPELTVQADIQYRRKEGGTFVGETIIAVVHDEEDKPVGYLRLIRDVSERIAHERELATRNAELQAITEFAPEMIARVDRQGRYLYVNRAWSDFTGIAAADYQGQPNEDLGFPEGFNRAWSEGCKGVLDTRTQKLIEVVFEHKNPPRSLQLLFAPEQQQEDGEVTTLLVFIRDVTEVRQAEQERVLADRLRTLGVLAGGVAHDFNNFIAALMNHVTLARAELSSEHPASPYLQECEPALSQARQLAQQLLTFAKGGRPIKRLLDLRKLTRETAFFALRGKGTVPVFDFEADTWPVEIDEGQIGQVLSNLLINADQASPDGSRITLRLRGRSLEAGEVADLREGPYVQLDVEDEGAGIPAEKLDQIFDPYFTTKATGNGLGLATVFSILLRHDGHVTVRSALGKGTCFSCFLPARPEARVAEAAQPEPQQHRGDARILLLEDQEIIARGLKRMLERVGYTVVHTLEGSQTLETFHAAADAGEPFDLVILDMTIPGGMGGLEVMQRLRDAHQDVRAIVSSGYSEAPVMAEPAAYGFNGVLPKPFQYQDLLRVVAEVLERRPGLSVVPAQ